MFMEYRLLVPNLVASVLAMLSIGTASALSKLAAKRYPGDLPRQGMAAGWIVGMGALITVVSVAIGLPNEHWSALDADNLLLHLLNAFSTAAAMLIAGSILFPLGIQSENQLPGAGFAATQRLRNVSALLMMTAIIGCYSALTLRRSYTSWYQLCCFLLAILCVSGNDIYDVIWNRPRDYKDTHEGYSLVANSPVLPPDSREEPNLVDLQIRGDFESRGLRSSMSSVALVILWTAFLSFNFGQRQYPRAEPLLDLKYQNANPLEVVISMYKERTEDVAALISNLESMPQMADAHVTIYLKNSEANEEKVKQETNAQEVIRLPNVGREAETYLNHIVNRWDSLAERTVFLQADVHNPREFYPFFEQYFRVNQTGFLNLGWVGKICNADNCGDRYGWQDETSLFPEIQSRIDHSTRDGFLLSYKGQFVVTAARIRGIDKAIYDDLRQLLVDENSWAHTEPYLQGRQDSMSQPFFGSTMERIWNLLFQCSDMDVAWRCPTLLSGRRPGGSIADCQCFDMRLMDDV
ncbi:hypothetical protein PTMSG1_09213 [Pyrenophora teres f. maculata]|nr:hypothetical protein PTMSG1_09213 [Pyrenophora teres f. maculata]